MAKKIIKGHGLRGADLADLKNDQINEAQDFNKSGNIDASYKFPESESHLVHASIEVETWEGGRKTSKPKVVTYDPRVFATQEANGGFNGYAVTILHNPDKYIKPEEIERIYVPADKAEDGANKDQIGGVSGDSSVALTAMNKTQLKAKYKEIFGEDAPKSIDSNEKLIDEIHARIKFNQEEAGNDGRVG